MPWARLLPPLPSKHLVLAFSTCSLVLCTYTFVVNFGFVLFFCSCMCFVLPVAPAPDPARGVGLVCCPFVLVGPFTVRLTVSGLPVLFICATVTKDSVGAPVRTSLLTPWVAIVGA